MKVPTYQKYGITKSELTGLENKHRKALDLLTHKIPFIVSIPIMTFIFIIYFSSSENSAVLTTISKIFVIGSVILMSVGIPMICFRFVGWLYSKYIITKSSKHQSIVDYTEVRDKYEFWKIRCDYNYWKLLDSLSLEKELLKVYLLNNYRLDREIKHRDGHTDYILSNANQIILRISSERHVISPDEVNYFISLLQEYNITDAIWFSLKGFEKGILENYSKNKIKFKTLHDIPKIVRDFKKGSDY